MTIPAWADEELSKRIAGIRAVGEGQRAEFKEEFPPQGHSLGTEVAAFASSGGGEVLLGVCNNGTVAGLDGDSEEKRDELQQRAHGIIGNVQPGVDYQLRFGFDGGCILAIIVADKQSEPVYYYHQRPYVRVDRTSRPANPEEVKTLVWSHPSSEHKRKMEELQLELLREHQADIAKINEIQRESMQDTMRSLLGDAQFDLPQS